MLFNNWNWPKLDLVLSLWIFELFSMNLQHRKCLDIIGLVYIFKKKSICASTFFQHVYIFKLIFHSMIYKIRTNIWRTEKFLSIHCFSNAKCNTHDDWLVEKQPTLRLYFWDDAHECKKITFVTCDLFRSAKKIYYFFLS